MATFVYTALAPNASRSGGEIEAKSRQEALRILEGRSLQVISLRSGEKAAPPERTSSLEPPSGAGPILLTGGQIIVFTEELSDLLDAGLQLEPALRSMQQRQELSGLKEVVALLQEKVTEGSSFSRSLREASASFGELYCNIVEAGELSGSLPKLLRRQARYLQTVDDLQNRVVQAFIYPSFIFTAGGVLIVVFMTYLVPQLTRMLKETGKTLPLATRLLIGFSDFAAAYGLWILGFFLIAGIAFAMAIRRPEGRFAWDRFILKTPVLGPVLTARIYAQFSQTLGNMVGNGIPLLHALQLMHRAAENTYFAGLLGRILEVVGDGGSLTRALRTAGHFPPLFVDIIAVGEQTGDLAAALEKAATRYDRELSRRIERMTSLIQPTIIVVMALLVGMVAYSMITGIFQTITGLRVH